jgi:hypothetical protein
MTDEDFLSRWSRRKRDVQAGNATKPSPPSDDRPSRQPGLPAAAGRTAPPEEFDLSSLPPLETITATTDITAFLRKGVPLELSRAALRRAWAADPAIRDFVGLAENAWDFNDPNAMPGFGPLDQTPEQVREMVARLMGETKPSPESDATSTKTDVASIREPDAAQPSSVDVRRDSPHHDTAEDVSGDSQFRTGEVAATQESDPVGGDVDAAASTKMVRRTHGGALPR